jgi:crossover junction endodeoxyribonuclease RusA
MTRIVLPWPPAALQPHAKGSVWPKIKATKAYRQAAFWIAREAGVRPDPTAVLTVTYHPPDRARRDCQNMHGRTKALIDGIADAMGCDDNGFRVRFPDSFGAVVKGGAIIVEVSA